eukprot:TRINITY_DN1119_c0_g3_i2.p1 TRINITY_DN1119_c0_g3~~TRINITY_DN1119_c0_g3_i2.p1  ORF type:complete len:638 (+),score=178.70 TRINITY_DN1119_c0_g3_i2:101-2014(+)
MRRGGAAPAPAAFALLLPAAASAAAAGGEGGRAAVRRYGADGCPYGAAWCSVGRSFGSAEEEPPEDERQPEEGGRSTPARALFCRVYPDGVPEPGDQPWQPPGLAVERFHDGRSIQQFFERNSDAACQYAHVVSGSRPTRGSGEDPQWFHKVVEALRGNLERELVVANMENEKTCKSFVGVKRLGLLERERCRLVPLLADEYAWCRCHLGKRTPKNMICVPGSHKFYFSPSPLANSSMTCVARLAYKAQHLAGAPAPQYTPHRAYPKDPYAATAAALAYINSQRVLEGTAETFQSWVPRFLAPQGIELFLIREARRIQEEDVIRLFGLSRARGGGHWEATVRGRQSPPIYLSNVSEGFPPGLDASALARVRPRCGCPPLCTGPTSRSPDAFMINGLRYVQGTSVFTDELLRDRRLARYDFIIKLDWDIRFFRTLREPVIQHVVRAGAIGFHTGFANNGNGCSRGTQLAMDSYAESRGTRAKSAGDWLYENEALAWHSALFGLWSGLLFSPEYRELIDALRNGPHGMAWFRHRWTDQSVWPKVVGYFHSDLATTLLDMRHLRWNPHAPRPKSVFYHRKKARGEGELCCGRCSDEAERPCFKPPYGRKQAGGSRVSAYVWCARPPGNVSLRIDLELCER